jgi:hypothetical protein
LSETTLRSGTPISAAVASSGNVDMIRPLTVTRLRMEAPTPSAASRRRRVAKDDEGSRHVAGPPMECSDPAAADDGVSARFQERGDLVSCGGGTLRVGGQAMLSKEGAVSAVRPLVDVAGRPRSPATMPGFHAGRAPRNKGQRYPADPPSVDEIVAVMRQARQARYGARLNGLIVVLWRAGLRIHEALCLMESDLDPRRGSILIKHGKGDRRREVGMDAWGKRRDEPAWRRR